MLQILFFDLTVPLNASVKFVMLYVFLIFSISCSFDINEKGMEDISELYGCTIRSSIKYLNNHEIENQPSLQIVLSNGDGINDQEPELIGSNSARLIFNSLTPEDRSKYSEINVRIELGNGNTSVSEYKYSTDELFIVYQKQYLYSDIMHFIMDQNYAYLWSSCFKGIKRETSTKDMTRLLSSLDDRFGPVKDSVIRGFMIFDHRQEGDEMKLVKFFGIQMRSKQNVNFNVTFSVDPEDEKIYAFDFYSSNSGVEATWFLYLP